MLMAQSFPGAALCTRFEPLADPAALAPRWQALEAAAAPNFFTGWTWMGSWLRATGARPEVLSVHDADGTEVALALLGRSRDKRLLGRIPTLRLNEAGDAAADRAFIEYNAPLCVAGLEAPVATAIGQALAARRDWRAIRLSGVLPGDPLVDAIPARRRLLLDRSPAYCVDLKAVRAGGDYLSLLSSNTRGQIRRSAKDYAPSIHVTRADTTEAVAAGLEEMRLLNCGRHADNAWDEPVFRAFAAEVAQAGLADGTVDLLRITAGEALLGYLLNFRSGGRAMNYQSAFAEPAGPKAKPGLMAHAAAVTHYAQAGLDLYSLLAGKDRYKQSLATGEETLEWWLLDRFDPRTEAEYWLRRLMRR